MNDRSTRKIGILKTVSAGKTDKGRIRANNEDSFLVADRAGLYAVADGIGGQAGGEVASRMAVQALEELLQTQASGTEDLAEVFANAFTNANARLLRAGSADPALFGMGTTLTALLFQGNMAHLAHLGDSRAYLLRNGALEQLSEDHGLVAEQVRAGLVTPDQARRSPYRHIITRALGIDSKPTVDRRTIEMRQQDIFLLCTDGLTEMVEDDEIERILALASPKEAVSRLITEANDHGGVDNITVVVVKIEASI